MTPLSRLRRVTLALTGLVSGLLGPGGAAWAQPQSMGAAEAPAEWVRYAALATESLTAWLEEDSESSAAFRAYLHQTRPAEDQPTPALMLKIWITPEGVVDRMDFPPFAHEAANIQLRAAVVGRALPAPPPRDMLLPLRLAIQLEAGRSETGSDGGEADRSI